MRAIVKCSKPLFFSFQSTLISRGTPAVATKLASFFSSMPPEREKDSKDEVINEKLKNVVLDENDPFKHMLLLNEVGIVLSQCCSCHIC
jgi:hypothetical protein